MDDAACEAALRRARQMEAALAGLQALDEADLAAGGIHPVTVEHGEVETDQDADLVYGTLHRLAGECGTLAGHPGRARIYDLAV